MRVAAKAVITPYNILTIPRLYRNLKNRGVHKIRLAAYSRSGFHHTDDLFNNPESYAWLQKEIEVLRHEFPEDDIAVQSGGPQLVPQSRQERLDAWSNRSLCSAGRTSMMVCADGKVIPCEQMPETEEYFCGDINHQSLAEIWNGDRLRSFSYGIDRERFKGQPCYDCAEHEECHVMRGFCIRDLAIHHGNIYQPAPNCPHCDPPFVRMT